MELKQMDEQMVDVQKYSLNRTFYGIETCACSSS